MKTASLESAATSSTKLVSSSRVSTAFTRTFGTREHCYSLSTTKIEELSKLVKELKTCLHSIETQTAYKCHCHNSEPADDENKYMNRKQDFEKEGQTEC